MLIIITKGMSLKISISYINKVGYIFNADDYMYLRKNYRILGNLIGHSSCNNANINGLPAILGRYELQLLLELNVIDLVDPNGLINPCTDDQIKEWHAFNESNQLEQHEALRQNKVRESEKVLDRLMAGKKKQLLNAGVKEEDINLQPDAVLQDVYNSCTFNADNTLLEIPNEHVFDVESTKVMLDADDSLKYLVFKDLWQRNKFLTNGETFGGDFLVYPGDPLLYHASHIVHIIEAGQIGAEKLVACGRLSVIVNKLCLFAYRSEQTVRYQTMQWKGNQYSRIDK